MDEGTIGYLQSDSDSDKLSLPIRLRERYLTPETKDVQLQAVGPYLQVSIWSDRSNIILRVPLRHWRTTKSYSGTLYGANNGILAVGRFEDDIDNQGDNVPVEIEVHVLDKPNP